MIGVDCRSVLAYPTGLLAYQRSLARYLPELAPAEHFAFLRAHGSSRRLSFHPNAHEVFVPGDPESMWAPMRLAHSVQTQGLRLFHATGGLYPSGLTVPVVTTVHDVLWLTEPSWLRPSGISGRLAAALCRRYLLQALRYSRRIIVPSHATRRAIDELAPFVSDRVSVIPHGVDERFVPLEETDEEQRAKERARCKHLLAGADRFVLDVGRAAAYRNHAGLIRAFASAFRSDESVHLAFVQAISDYSSSMARLAGRLGIENRVHILSGVSSSDLVMLYRSALALCHPTLHEAFGTVVAEAMACGCPVITSARTGAAEMVEGVAQLINPEHEEEIAAALRRVAYEPGVAERLRSKGLERAKALSARTMAQATWQVYEQVLSEAERSGTNTGSGQKAAGVDTLQRGAKPGAVQGA